MAPMLLDQIDQHPPAGTAESQAVAVQCENVVKKFGDGANAITVLHGIDLVVPSGELSMLVGPSGCGKTTLLSIIAGILSPNEGEVWIHDTCLTRLRDREKVAFRREQIGFVFQQYNLLPALTAAENASVPLLAAGWNARDARDKAAEMLGKLGMSPHVDKRPNQLSGGQQQRVAIARALVHDPTLVVCDEPTAALDAHSGQVVMQLLREIAVVPGRAVIVVTHDNRIFHYADTIAHMEDGRLDKVERGAKEQGQGAAG